MRDALGLVAIGHDDEGVAGVRHAFKAENLDGGGGAGFGLDRTAAVIEHGADFAESVADDVAVAQVLKGTVLHEDAGDGTAAAIELGFDNRADGGTILLGLLLVGVGEPGRSSLPEPSRLSALLGGNFDELGVATQ